MWLFPSWFLFLNGIFLLILGMLTLRSRFQQTDSISAFCKSSGFLWAFLCISMGVLLLVMGFGHIPQPGLWIQKKKDLPIVFPREK